MNTNSKTQLYIAMIVVTLCTLLLSACGGGDGTTTGDNHGCPAGTTYNDANGACEDSSGNFVSAPVQPTESPADLGAQLDELNKGGKSCGYNWEKGQIECTDGSIIPALQGQSQP